MIIDVIRYAVRVGPEGKVVKHWRMVTRAADHPARVLQLLQGAFAQTICLIHYTSCPGIPGTPIANKPPIGSVLIHGHR